MSPPRIDNGDISEKVSTELDEPCIADVPSLKTNNGDLTDCIYTTFNSGDPEGLAKDKGLIKLLNEKGYDQFHCLSVDGRTRLTYLVGYKSGLLDQVRIMKITRINPDTESLGFLINKYFHDIQFNELKLPQAINHPNITQPIDHFRYMPKNPALRREIFIETAFAGDNVKLLSRNKMNDDTKVYKVFYQIAQALAHLHKKGWVHRDVKSANMIVNKDNIAKIGDMQNAGKVWDIKRTHLHVRGSSEYTHPRYLNAVVTGEAIDAGYDMDRYGFGASFFEALAGEVPFDYKLVLHDKGVPVIIGDKTYHARLMVDMKPVDIIDMKSHEKRLKKVLHKVGIQYRPIISKLLTMDEKKAYHDTEELVADIENLNKPSMRKWMERIYSSMKAAALLAVGLGVGYGVGLGLLHESNKPYTPTLHDHLKKKEYQSFFLEDSSMHPEVRLKNEFLKWNAINNQMDYVKRGLRMIEALPKRDELSPSSIEDYARFAEECHHVPQRLAASILRAVKMTDTTELRAIYGNNRIMPTGVPRDFMIREDVLGGIRNPENEDIGPRVAFGFMYMNGNISLDKDVADAIAAYFCSSKEIKSAFKSVPGMNYFDMIDSSGNVAKGYRHALDPRKVALIDRTYILTAMTKDDASYDLNRLPNFNIPEKGYVMH